MKTAVIIPAFNEESCIAETLRSLPGDLVDPIVAVNGSSDQTATIAEDLGATVMNFEQQGKLPAIQQVLRHLGKRALDPLIILDADTRPIMPRAWHNKMLKFLTAQPELPAVVGGPVWFDKTSLVNSSLRCLLQYRETMRTSRDNRIRRAGPNMGLYIQNEITLDKILALPHYWPREDQAIVREIRRRSGTYTQPMNPTLHAITRIHVGMPSILERVRIGKQAYGDRYLADYINRAAPGSMPANIV